MLPVRMLAFALLCASASGDTWVTQNGIGTEKRKEFHEYKRDIGTHVKNQRDRNEYCNSNFDCNDAVKTVAHGSRNEDIIYTLTDEEYYRMPQLFHLDEYRWCLALKGAYCLGSFELSSNEYNPLFNTMQRYSANWVDNYNHTRLHRGICLQRSCLPPDHYTVSTGPSLETWFASCVNASTMFAYNLSASLYKLDYCTQGPEQSGPLTAGERSFAGLIAILIVFAATSTTLDLTLDDETKKSYGWALSWSIRSSWHALTVPNSVTCGTNLKVFDGLRILCILCVILEHVAWLNMQTYVADIQFVEQARRSPDGILLTNSSLVLQIFFLITSFLLAHKVMRQSQHLPAVSTFLNTMLYRIVRISPSYIVVLWFSASWWERLGEGPLWIPLVRPDASGCRHNWWKHLLYIHCLQYPDEVCLPHTWYLGADMHLYALALALTLALRGRRNALPVLGLLFVSGAAVCLVLAYILHLVPTFVLHRPELIRAAYRDDLSFVVLYAAPWSNATGVLAGLILAHLHDALNETSIRINEYKVFRWVSNASAPAALLWMAVSPLMLGEGPPSRFPAVVLAAFERTVFILLVSLSLLGAINNVEAPQHTWISRGTTVMSRLSYGVFLVHMSINKSLLATRIAPTQFDRLNIVFEWLGVTVVSYAAAIPLALLVQLPAQRLHKEITTILSKRRCKPNEFKILDKNR